MISVVTCMATTKGCWTVYKEAFSFKGLYVCQSCPRLFSWSLSLSLSLNSLKNKMYHLIDEETVSSRDYFFMVLYWKQCMDFYSLDKEIIILTPPFIHWTRTCSAAPWIRNGVVHSMTFLSKVQHNTRAIEEGVPDSNFKAYYRPGIPDSNFKPGGFQDSKLIHQFWGKYSTQKHSRFRDSKSQKNVRDSGFRFGLRGPFYYYISIAEQTILQEMPRKFHFKLPIKYYYFTTLVWVVRFKTFKVWLNGDVL